MRAVIPQQRMLCPRTLCAWACELVRSDAGNARNGSNAEVTCEATFVLSVTQFVAAISARALLAITIVNEEEVDTWEVRIDMASMRASPFTVKRVELPRRGWRGLALAAPLFSKPIDRELRRVPLMAKLLGRAQEPPMHRCPSPPQPRFRITVSKSQTFETSCCPSQQCLPHGHPFVFERPQIPHMQGCQCMQNATHAVIQALGWNACGMTGAPGPHQRRILPQGQLRIDSQAPKASPQQETVIKGCFSQPASLHTRLRVFTKRQNEYSINNA
jgi:hypothetical protein